jgi:hypothetical protein
MRKYTRILASIVVLAAAGWFASCNSTIDKEPNVVLEVAQLTIPPITTATSGGICTFTITNANATFNNKPKNSLAGSSEAPFNDIVLQQVVVGYAWDDPLVATTPNQVFGIGGTVPAGGSSSAQFSVVNNAVLTSGTPRDGHTASLTMVFSGATVAGEPVSVTSGGSLTINTCTTESFGACCTGVSSGACSDLTQTNCIALGGGAVFQGNNTQCITTVCP